MSTSKSAFLSSRTTNTDCPYSNCILEHVWNGRPPTAKTLLPLYLAHPTPRPSVIYIPDTNPPSIVYSILEDRLTFLSPSSNDSDPLAILEFLHRVADALVFFQAEDGIRDLYVTGVQTCALPISLRPASGLARRLYGGQQEGDQDRD